MLVIKFLNDGTGTKEVGNYQVTVQINRDIIYCCDLTGHNRNKGWESLVKQFVEENCCLYKIEEEEEFEEAIREIFPFPSEPPASKCFPVFYNALLEDKVSFNDNFKVMLMGDEYEFNENQKTYADVEQWELPSGNGYEKGGKLLYKKEVQVYGNIEFEQVIWRVLDDMRGLGPITLALVYDVSHPDLILAGYIRVGKLNWINDDETNQKEIAKIIPKGKWGIVGRRIDPQCDLHIVGISFYIGE